MTALEVILLVCGVICVILSFVLSGKNDEVVQTENGDPNLTNQQKEEIRKQIDDIVKAELENINERTEASLDKISNTKILEMNEYAETVMGEINRNHNETVFLYDMLNEKAKEIKNTVKDVNNAKRQVEKIQSEVTLTSEEKDDVNEAVTLEDETGKKTVRDDAKERLSELVRQSNEKAKKQNISLSGGHQANSLNNMVHDLDQKEESADTINKSNKDNAADKTVNKTANKDQNKSENKTKNKSQKKTENKDDLESEKKEQQNQENHQNDVQESSSNKNEEKTTNIQFEKGTINNDKILELSQSGMSNKDIAKNLNLGIGEVKLVVDLYRTEKNN